MVLTEVDFRGTERFVIRRRLGAGTFGVVYEAEDRERGEVIALKALRFSEPGEIYRLKKEFRTLADVAHPNLVSLYELVATDDAWFFTMELVDGYDFLTYVRGPESGGEDTREERLRSALSQLVRGVAALHRAGRLHRDLKPSNVLTTRDGRVVILDFGISAELQQSHDPRTRTVEERGILGSPSYMAPEQFFGSEEVTEASDWYAVGTMLYEALTGQLPFTGKLGQLMTAKNTLTPVPPNMLVPGCPPDLAALAMSLMEREPALRCKGHEVLRRVSGETAAATLTDTDFHPSLQLVGREAHLAALESAFAAMRATGPVTVYVSGASGIGKSALVQSFTEELTRREGAVVLGGRCYVRESVPHKALDGIVDSLSRYLRALRPGEIAPLMPSHVGPLLRTFPVLERVEALATAEQKESHPYDAIDLRRHAFRSLRELLAKLAAAHPLVLAIDDLQWADESSVRVLEDLLRGPDAPRALLLATFRSEEVRAHRFLQAAVARGNTAETRQLAIDALTREQTITLVEQLFEAEAADVPRHIIEQVATEAAGSPFLAEQLARHVQAAGSEPMRGVSLPKMLDARIRLQPPEARVFLSTLAVAGRPLDPDLVRDAADLKASTRALVVALETGHLLRSSTSANHVELYHDRIREALVAQIPDDDRRAIHLKLAHTFERMRPDDAEALFEHCLLAGLTIEAAKHAARAARQAAATLGFDRAVLFYKRALELIGPASEARGPLQAELAEALTNSGRMAEAAHAFQIAASLTRSVRALEYQRRAAEQFLMGGHTDSGLEVLRRVLSDVGIRMPSGPKKAIVLFLLRRIQLAIRGTKFVERKASEIPEAVLRQIDICWAGSAGLGLTETVRASYFQSLHMLLALRAGEPHRIARAFAVETSFSATPGKARARVDYWRNRTWDLASRLADPQAMARAQMTDGLASFLSGDFRRANTLCEDAEAALLAHPTGMTWELAAARNFWVSSAAYLGDVTALAQRVPALLRDARDRGNLYISTQVRLRGILFWLAQDDPEGGRAGVDDAIAGWSTSHYYVQHANGMNARVQLDLYTGDAYAAWRRITEGWAPMKKSLLMRVKLLYVEAYFLRARAALLRATERIDREDMLREAERAAHRIERTGMPWTRPIVALVRAALNAQRGDDAAARTLLADAAQGFDAHEMSLLAAAARRRYGELTGGTEGAAAVAAADARLRQQLVANPARLVAMYAPGFASA